MTPTKAVSRALRGHSFGRNQLLRTATTAPRARNAAAPVRVENTSVRVSCAVVHDGAFCYEKHRVKFEVTVSCTSLATAVQRVDVKTMMHVLKSRDESSGWNTDR